MHCTSSVIAGSGCPETITPPGDLTIKKPSGWGNNHNRRIPKVVIGPGSRVGGTIIIEQKVELFVSTTAEVGGVRGVMTMEDAVRFDGDWP